MSEDDVTTRPGRPTEKWVTGDELMTGEEMTGPQHSFPKTLAHEAGTDAPDELTRAVANEQIERLQQQTGRRPHTT